jgi:hypothetical protein
VQKIPWEARRLVQPEDGAAALRPPASLRSTALVRALLILNVELNRWRGRNPL